MRLVWCKVELKVFQGKYKLAVIGRGPVKVQRHPIKTNISGTNISEKWRIAYVSIIEFDVKRQLVDLESSAIVAKNDYCTQRVQVRLGELELRKVEFERHKVDYVQSLIDIQVSRRSISKRHKQGVDKVDGEIVEKRLEKSQSECLHF